MAAGVRGLLAFWVGGASASPSQAGVRSFLAPWIGGASAEPAGTTQAGFRSLLAPWLGGASAQHDNAPQSRGFVITRAYLLRMQAARRALAKKAAQQARRAEDQEKALEAQQPTAAALPLANVSLEAPPGKLRRSRRRRDAEMFLLGRLALDD
jgi:hypothetical protein